MAYPSYVSLNSINSEEILRDNSKEKISSEKDYAFV